MKTFITGVLLILTACSSKQKSSEKYFDFDGLINSQISQLSQRMRVLDKRAELKGIQSDTTFVPDTKGWEAELDLFRRLEALNKPIHQKTYQVEGPLDDPKSNLKIIQYKAPSSSLPFIKIYYLTELNRVRKIEGMVSESNILYAGSQWMTMEFEEEEGRPILIRYGVRGFQKLVMRDSVNFSVQGQINW